MYVCDYAEYMDDIKGHRDDADFRQILEEQLMAGQRIGFAPANMNRQRAASVGALALRYYRDGRTESAAFHKPDYLRASQAERERHERERKEKKGEV